MIIKSIKIKNYRRFRNLELELPENIIGIIGYNGVGKTTIVEAIGWCLYGNRIRRTDKQDIRSQFCDPSDVCAVELIFSCGDHEYRIERKLKGKTANVEAAIYINANPEPMAVQERGVNEYVEKLLNLDYKSFFISVFARQRDLAALSTLQPEERRKSIARLINIENIDRARVEIRSDRKSKENIRSGIESSLKDEKELKQQRKQLKLELTTAEQSKNELEDQLKEVQEKLRHTKEEYDKLSKLRDQYHSIQSRIEKWKSHYQEKLVRKQKHIEQIAIIKKAEQELNRLKPQLIDYKRIQREKERLDKNSANFNRLQAMNEEKERLSQRISREQFSLTKLKEELKGLEGIDEKVVQQDEKVNQLEREREALRQELSKNEGLIANITAKGKEIRQKKEKIEKLGPQSPCPVCTRPLDDHYQSVLSQFEDELKELRQQYVLLDGSQKELKVKIQHIDEQLKENKPLRDALLQAHEQFKEREKQMQQVKDTLRESIESLKELDKKIDALGKIKYDEKRHKEIKKQFQELSELRDQMLKFEENVKRLPDEEQELEQIKSELKDLKSDIEHEEEQLKVLSYDEQKFLLTKHQVDEQQKQVDLIKDEINKVEQKIISIKKDKERVIDELNTTKELQDQIKQLQEEIVYLNALDYHLGIFRQELAGRIRPLIANRASELLQLTTQGKYSILELDEDYNIFLYDQTSRFPLARFSGGEQDLANLCLRIAISQVVADRAGRSQINFIVLDEIFGSQDEQRKDMILNALQHLTSQFRQIFIITHVDGIKDALPVVISVKEKSVEESEAELM